MVVIGRGAVYNSQMQGTHDTVDEHNQLHHIIKNTNLAQHYCSCIILYR